MFSQHRQSKWYGGKNIAYGMVFLICEDNSQCNNCVYKCFHLEFLHILPLFLLIYIINVFLLLYAEVILFSIIFSSLYKKC